MDKQPRLPFDREPVPFSNETTSRAAAEAIEPRRGAQKKRVLAFIRDRWENHRLPTACFNVERELKMKHETASPIIRSLREDEYAIYEHAQVRRPDTGRACIAYRTTSKAEAETLASKRAPKGDLRGGAGRIVLTRAMLDAMRCGLEATISAGVDDEAAPEALAWVKAQLWKRTA